MLHAAFIARLAKVLGLASGETLPTQRVSRPGHPAGTGAADAAGKLGNREDRADREDTVSAAAEAAALEAARHAIAREAIARTALEARLSRDAIASAAAAAACAATDARLAAGRRRAAALDRRNTRLHARVVALKEQRRTLCAAIRDGGMARCGDRPHATEAGISVSLSPRASRAHAPSPSARPLPRPPPVRDGAPSPGRAAHAAAASSDTESSRRRGPYDSHPRRLVYDADDKRSAFRTALRGAVQRAVALPGGRRAALKAVPRGAANDGREVMSSLPPSARTCYDEHDTDNASEGGLLDPRVHADFDEWLDDDNDDVGSAGIVSRLLEGCPATESASDPATIEPGSSPAALSTHLDATHRGGTADVRGVPEESVVAGGGGASAHANWTTTLLSITYARPRIGLVFAPGRAGDGIWLRVASIADDYDPGLRRPPLDAVLVAVDGRALAPDTTQTTMEHLKRAARPLVLGFHSRSSTSHGRGTGSSAIARSDCIEGK
mmetsp:Transcript_15047/g.60417  ORF Transcript_15047/g.60417 Transcript_15047/m.60417 type:complete len:497 (+) Transcript_15047:1025-2515(+)